MTTTLIESDSGEMAEVNSAVALASSGTAVTIDPDTGFPDVLIINASYGFGHTVSEGLVCPDEYRLFKPFIDQAHKDPLMARNLGSKSIQKVFTSNPAQPYNQQLTNFEAKHHFALSEKEIRTLAKTIMDAVRPDEVVEVEWQHVAESETFDITQIRPLTFEPPHELDLLVRYELTNEHPHLIASGLAIGNHIAHGSITRVRSLEEAQNFPEGSILVTEHIDQSWRQVLEKASGIITDTGSRVCQAATLARELNLPAILGTENATKTPSGPARGHPRLLQKRNGICLSSPP